MKPVVFWGDSLEVIKAFPVPARRRAGYQLDRVQNGLAPNDWKPMPSIGAAVREIRIRDSAGAFRVIEVAHVADAAYVLQPFRRRHGRPPRRISRRLPRACAQL